MTIPLITALPSPAPSTEDPGNFDPRADALLGALPTMVTEENTSITAMNAAITQMNLDIANISAAALVSADAAGFVATSTSTLQVNAGTKTIHFDVAKPNFNVSDQVVIVLRSDPSIKMFGLIATMDAGNDDITVTVVTSGVSGSGEYSNWLIISGAFLGAGATAAEIRAGASDAVSMTPKGEYDALAEVALTSSSSVVAVNMANFINGYHLFTENTEFANPSNAKPGQTGYIRVQQHASSAKTGTFAANWKRAGGDPTFSTTLSGYDFIVYQVITSTYILYDLIKNPS